MAPSVAACHAYKYVANRALTIFQNFFLRAHLSEYHTGFRAFSAELLRLLPLQHNSDDFVFDNQVLAQCILLNARIGEISCPTRYFEEASSINFPRSVRYGFGVLKTTMQCVASKWGLTRRPRFNAEDWGSLEPAPLELPDFLEEASK